MKICSNINAISLTLVCSLSLLMTGCKDDVHTDPLSKTTPINESVKPAFDSEQAQTATIEDNNLAESETQAQIADESDADNNAINNDSEYTEDDHQTLINSDGELTVTEDDIGLPTGAVDKSAFRQPTDSATIDLKISEYVPDLVLEQKRVLLYQCKDIKNVIEDDYYCTDKYLLEVQNSNYRVELNGGEIVLSNFPDLRLDYIVTYVKDGVAMPTGWYLTKAEGLDAKMGKVGDAVCFYGELTDGFDVVEDYYTCLRYSNYYEDQPDIYGPTVFDISTYENVVNQEHFAGIVSGKLDTNYSDFMQIKKDGSNE